MVGQEAEEAGAGAGEGWSGRREGWWALGAGAEEASSVGCAMVHGAQDVRACDR
jgi:hypothetical protein